MSESIYNEAGQPTSLASIYQARKSGHGDSTVHVLKKQFQSQIERIIHEKGHVPKGYIPSSNEREVREFKVGGKKNIQKYLVEIPINISVMYYSSVSYVFNN